MLRRVAEPVESASPLPNAGGLLLDATGAHWPGDMPFLVWRRDDTTAASTSDRHLTPDQRVWADLVAGTHPNQVLGRFKPDGSLENQSAARTIEVWTEQELSSMQALDWLTTRTAGDESSAAAARLDAAIAWHLDHTQPDNATNRPWGIAAFLGFAKRNTDAFESVLYAETLLHNAMAGGGTPDAFSAQILLDAAQRLEEPLASD